MGNRLVSCTRVALPAEEFETMRTRVCRYRARVDEIGAISGPVIWGREHDARSAVTRAHIVRLMAASSSFVRAA